MFAAVKNLFSYHELIGVLAWRNILVRYKQAYFGIAWAVLKPLLMMLIFTLVRGFVGIESGDIPYPILTFAALMPWTLFQESTTEGTTSVVRNAVLIRKIYFPRIIFPLTAITGKLIEFCISIVILAGLMIWYRMAPTIHVLWAPLFVIYTLLVSLTVSLVGAGLNVYYRDIGQGLPIALTMLMYASPVIYPLQLVKDKLLAQQAAGEWSDLLYTVYTMNPMAGIIDGFQNAVLRGTTPDLSAMLPGMVFIIIALPLGYLVFKRAERYFADVI